MLEGGNDSVATLEHPENMVMFKHVTAATANGTPTVLIDTMPMPDHEWKVGWSGQNPHGPFAVTTLIVFPVRVMLAARSWGNQF